MHSNELRKLAFRAVALSLSDMSWLAEQGVIQGSDQEGALLTDAPPYLVGGLVHKELVRLHYSRQQEAVDRHDQEILMNTGHLVTSSPMRAWLDAQPLAKADLVRLRSIPKEKQTMYYFED